MKSNEYNFRMDDFMNNEHDDNERRLYKEELIYKLWEEVDRLEYLIKKYKFLKFRNLLIKRLKVVSKVLKLVTPYLVAVSLVSGIYITEHEDNKQYLYTRKKYDEDKNVIYLEELQGQDLNLFNRLSYYGKWRIDEDGSYTRDVLVYDISKLNEEKLLELYDMKDINLDKLFGEPIVKYSETFLYLSSWELVKNNFYRADIYIKDKNEYIILEEEREEDVLLSLISIALLIESFAFISLFIGNQSYKELKETYYNMMNEEDKLEKIDILKRKLEISRSNYDRVMKYE